MIHGKSSVELAVIAQSEETVRRIWSECHYTLLIGSLDCRSYDSLLLAAEKAVVTAMRIETENCNLWFRDSEIPSQGCVHKAELGENLFLTDGCRYVLERDMTCHNTDFEMLADHEHCHIRGSELFLQIFGMTGEAEARR